MILKLALGLPLHYRETWKWGTWVSQPFTRSTVGRRCCFFLNSDKQETHWSDLHWQQVKGSQRWWHTWGNRHLESVAVLYAALSYSSFSYGKIDIKSWVTRHVCLLSFTYCWNGGCLMQYQQVKWTNATAVRKTSKGQKTKGFNNPSFMSFHPWDYLWFFFIGTFLNGLLALNGLSLVPKRCLLLLCCRYGS